MKLLRLKVVLATIAGDDNSVDVLRGARGLAEAADAELHVLHVASGDAETLAARRMTQQLLERAGVGTSVNTHFATGEPASAIRLLADRIRADVIVLGRHRSRAPKTAGLGSTALAVVTNSWAPCLILSDVLRLPLGRVLVPLDLSDTSRGALVVALSWASALRGTRRGEAPVALTALVVKTREHGSPSDQQALDGELQRIRSDAGSWAHVTIDAAVVVREDVLATIADAARDREADLIVLGTRGLGAGPVGRLGSVSLGVAQRVSTPILLVPPAVWSAHASADP